MDKHRLETLLAGVRSGEVSIDEALRQLKDLPYEDLGFAKVDHHRALRTGHTEVVFCPGKEIGQIVTIVDRLAQRGGAVMATRASQEVAAALSRLPYQQKYHESARIVVVGPTPAPRGRGTILIVSGGTADQPVAEEAAVTAETLGNRVERLYDVGVAGIHRLLDNRDRLAAATVLVVVAGMEGALASVVAGLVARPVVAVPTSVGYGANFGGLAALLAMLNSCASGVGVVNIDNGFGAGVMASLINREEEAR
ncbi:MAG: nickel pincer cofactor biosynthesis protein LarB [Chloroflexota bacterium]